MPSIIVPARNGGDYTKTCLSSLLYSLSQLKLACEFILVDDDSNPEDNILEIFRQHRANAIGHECKIVRAKRHLHYTGAFSTGLHFATRDVIFFISNDMVVPPNFIEALLLVSSLSQEFGIVRGTSNHTDSHPEHRVRPRETPQTFAAVDEFSRTVFRANPCAYVEDSLLSGDAILIKRSVLEKIGVLDMRFFGYFGDVDFGMRAHLAGFKLACAKGAWLYHDGAGHVKAELQKRKDEIYDDMHRQRMNMVDAAYQEFRKKWNIAAPAEYNQVKSLHYFEQARANARSVPLKCEYPQSCLSELEIY